MKINNINNVFVPMTAKMIKQAPVPKSQLQPQRQPQPQKSHSMNKRETQINAQVGGIVKVEQDGKSVWLPTNAIAAIFPDEDNRYTNIYLKNSSGMDDVKVKSDLNKVSFAFRSAFINGSAIIKGEPECKMSNNLSSDKLEEKNEAKDMDENLPLLEQGKDYVPVLEAEEDEELPLLELGKDYTVVTEA